MLYVAVLCGSDYAMASACARILGMAWWARGRRAAVVETAASPLPWTGLDEGPALIALLSPAGRTTALESLAKAHEATAVACDRSFPIEAGLLFVACEPTAAAIKEAADVLESARASSTEASMRVLRVSPPGTHWSPELRASLAKAGLIALRSELVDPKEMARRLGSGAGLDKASVERRSHLADEIDALAAAPAQAPPASQEAFESTVVAYVADLERHVTELTSLNPDASEDQTEKIGSVRMRLMICVEQLRNLLGLHFQNGETFYVSDSIRFKKAADATQAAMAQVDETLTQMAERHESTRQVPSLHKLLDKVRRLVRDLEALRQTR